MSQVELLILSRIQALIEIIEKRLDIVLEMQDIISENKDPEITLNKLKILLDLNKKL